MNAINPADCLPGEFYMGSTWGERRIMGRRSPDNPYPWHVLGGGVRSDDEVSDLVRLAPVSQSRQWTREDLLSRDEAHKVYRALDCLDDKRALRATLDAVVEHLEKHYPKPEPRPYQWGGVGPSEAAEKRYTWPKTTPTGHAYVEPNTYSALCHEHDNAAQGAVESWDADECPPEPTWEMVGIARREVERLQRERDVAVSRAVAAEARTAPAVTVEQRNAVADHLWNAMAGSAKSVVRDVVRDAFYAAGIETGIEAEPADPVEDKARELFDEAGRGSSKIEFDEIRPDHRGEYLRIAAHILGREAGNE